MRSRFWASGACEVFDRGIGSSRLGCQPSAGCLYRRSSTKVRPAGFSLQAWLGSTPMVQAVSIRRTTGSILGSLLAVALAAPAARAASRVYWANYTANKISYANLDGSGGGDTSISGGTVNGPIGVTFDPANGRLYWANYGANKISYANLDGSGGGDRRRAARRSARPRGFQSTRPPAASTGPIKPGTKSPTQTSTAPVEVT